MSQPRAHTLRYQSAVNRVIIGLLHVPLLARALGSRLVVIEVVGRKSGRRFSVPVAYTRKDGDLLIGTPFGWGRNLRTGEPVTVWLRGRRMIADVEAIIDHAGVVDAYAIMARDNRQFAAFNSIALDQDGDPDPDDLQLAWAGGARAFRLSGARKCTASQK